MKIVFLDVKTLGDDIDLSNFKQFGEIVQYDYSTPTEIPDRVKDADIIIINKVSINQSTIHTVNQLKLVCVTATGTDNLDKDYLETNNIAWRNVTGYSTNSVAQHTFALLFYLLEKLNYYDTYVKNGNYSNNKIFTHLEEKFAEIEGKTSQTGYHSSYRLGKCRSTYKTYEYRLRSNQGIFPTIKEMHRISLFTFLSKIKQLLSLRQK